MGGLLGLGGGASGTGFAAPQATTLTPGTSAGQQAQAYTTNQDALRQQQILLNALGSADGIGNQSRVYGQLQQVAAGQGPNPAAAMLNQATGQNVANQAALMAGQRGASSNAGLLAREAAQQGAATQQQAVGQGAALQAQQSLGALGAAGSLAQNQAAQQVGAIQSNTAAQQQEQQILQQALANQNNQNVAMQSNVNNANAGLASTQMQGQHELLGGVLGGVGSALGLAEGGEIDDDQSFSKGFADSYGSKVSPLTTGLIKLGGGIRSMLTNSTTPTEAPLKMPGPVSAVGKFLTGAFEAPQGGPQADASGTLLAALGGNVGSKLKQGGKVPGKPKVGGKVDSYANDTIDAKLSPGEIVLPRSVTQSADPVGESARFVQNELAKRGKK